MPPNYHVTSKWDERFMDIAWNVAGWSKDVSRKVGCVAVKNRRIVATGYNGFPAGIADTPERQADRDVKYQFTVHGEMNCIFNAAANGISLSGATVYVTTLPVCSECGKGLISAGVERVVMCIKESPVPPKWSSSFEVTRKMFDETHVDYCFLDLQTPSVGVMSN